MLNWFRAEGRLSSGVVQGFNNKLKLVTKKSYGFRTQEAYENALYHNWEHYQNQADPATPSIDIPVDYGRLNSGVRLYRTVLWTTKSS